MHQRPVYQLHIIQYDTIIIPVPIKGLMSVIYVLVNTHTQWRRNLFGRHGQSRTTLSGGTALNVNCRTTFQAHETFNHHVSDSQSQQTEFTYITRIQTLITQVIQKP